MSRAKLIEMARHNLGHATAGTYDDMLAHFDFSNWHMFSRRTVAGPNWKIAYDGYLDFYHLPILHKDTFGSDFSSEALYYSWGPHQRVSSPDAGLRDFMNKPEEEWPTELLLSGVWTIFPHVSIAGFDGGGRGVMISQLFPGGKPGESFMSEHPGIDCITATASITAGRDIMRRAAVNLKRISLELGGHAPFIVMPDADIEAAAKAAMRRSFSNMGQICISVNRILTHERVHDDFVEALAAETRAIELGRGLDPGVTYGPVLDEAVISRVETHIDDAIRKGAKIIVGGDRAAEGHLSKGYFFKPTLIDNASLDSLPMREETYGPLAALHTCDTIDEILEISNSLGFGLAAYIYSEDLEAAWSLADRLEFGAVGINVSDTSELQAPFGGWKLSGVGRELGIEGLKTFLEPKHIKMRVRPQGSG